jgi:hypothetical protein
MDEDEPEEKPHVAAPAVVAPSMIAAAVPQTAASSVPSSFVAAPPVEDDMDFDSNLDALEQLQASLNQ